MLTGDNIYEKYCITHIKSIKVYIVVKKLRTNILLCSHIITMMFV